MNMDNGLCGIDGLPSDELWSRLYQINFSYFEKINELIEAVNKMKENPSSSLDKE